MAQLTTSSSSRTTATQHSAATQKAMGGYSKGQRVHHNGVVWISLKNSNLTLPGDDSSWDLSD